MGGVAGHQLKRHYDGYHFCAGSPDIYNPFSLLGALDTGRTKAYWFESGTPTALINLLEQHSWDIAGLEGCVAREDDFDAPTERMQTPLPMLYQGGYLTIKGYNPVRESYTLGIPNEEVRRGLSNCLVRHAAPEADLRHYGFLDSLADELNAGDVDRALQLTRSYLAGIPYHLGSRDERGFQTTFFLIFDLLGIQIETEFKTATGRVDAVVRAGEAVYVFKFKYGRSAAEALAQIDDRGYMVPFAREGLAGRRLVKVGVSLSEETRTIEEWVVREGWEDARGERGMGGARAARGHAIRARRKGLPEGGRAGVSGILEMYDWERRKAFSVSGIVHLHGFVTPKGLRREENRAFLDFLT